MASFDSIFQEIVDQNWEQVMTLVASTTSCASKDEFGFSPLHVCLQDEAPEEVQLAIIHKYPKAVEEPSGDGDLALLYALRNAASLQVTQLLLDTHPTAVSTISPDGDYPLHIAIQYGAENNIIEKLVELYPEACKVTNEDEDLPLHLAFQNNASISTIELLIASHPDGVALPGSEGQLPVEMASENNFDMDVITPLLQVAKRRESVKENYRWYWQAYRTWVPYSSLISERIEQSYQTNRDMVEIDGGRCFKFDMDVKCATASSSSSIEGHKDVMQSLLSSSAAVEKETTVVVDDASTVPPRAEIFGLQYVKDSPGRHRRATRLLVPVSNSAEYTLRHMSFGTLHHLDASDGHASRLTAAEKESFSLDKEYSCASVTRSIREQLDGGSHWIMGWE